MYRTFILLHIGGPGILEVLHLAAGLAAPAVVRLLALLERGAICVAVLTGDWVLWGEKMKRVGELSGGETMNKGEGEKRTMLVS